ncbi:unnamed protein product [Rhizoctonia solani]|uniref:Protein kinase domain-containing protein n=1 Tax=Rhizoctonia solani TaxID=456999 RepID=A0A8H3E6T5_9AGAM|nr:unnamed protein product [Rhizoctonia solani]
MLVIEKTLFEDSFRRLSVDLAPKLKLGQVQEHPSFAEDYSAKPLCSPSTGLHDQARDRVVFSPSTAALNSPAYGFNTIGVEDFARPREMSTDEMFECLLRHGCPDLTEFMNPDAYSKGFVAAGGFGDIWKGKLRDGTAVAIKVWRFRALEEDIGKDIKRAMREIYNWSKLDHESIQKLLGVVVFEGRLGMVSEWMDGGNLQHYLQRNPHVDRYPLCIQVAQGVEYLHTKNMIHGDLKAINILVSSKHRLKLTDFDHSIMAECTLQFSETTRMGGGTLRWMTFLVGTPQRQGFKF